MSNYKPKDPIYKAEKPYSEDINDLIEKGRGPDKSPRKKRESYKGHEIEQTGGSYTHMTESGSKTTSTPHTEEHHVTTPDGKPYHTTFSSREHAKAHIDKLTKGWQQHSPKPGYSYASNADQGKVEGVGGGKFQATDTRGKKDSQKYGNAEEAKNALAAKTEKPQGEK